MTLKMLRALNLWRVSPSAILPFIYNRSKYDNVPTDTVKPQSGYERLKQMFSRNEYEETSVELHSILQTTMTGTFTGACIGGFVKSREAYLYFIETNQATIFKTTLEAQKKLQNYVTIAFARGATYWGWRFAIFTGTFTLISTSSSVYNGETSVLDYTIGGAVTGAMYKAHLGLAAACVGFGLGAVLSTIGGTFIVLLLKLTGVSMDDIRRALYSVKEARESQMHQAIEKSSEIKNDEITKHHDILVQEKGEKKIDEL